MLYQVIINFAKYYHLFVINISFKGMEGVTGMWIVKRWVSNFKMWLKFTKSYVKLNLKHLNEWEHGIH